MAERSADWWITTDFLNRGGRKVMGPFVSSELAREVRALREQVEGHWNYFIDSSPTPPAKTDGGDA